jgi:heme/copper-type cytochrome/quinol oxidase subunit 1
MFKKLRSLIDRDLILKIVIYGTFICGAIYEYFLPSLGNQYSDRLRRREISVVCVGIGIFLMEMIQWGFYRWDERNLNSENSTAKSIFKNGSTYFYLGLVLIFLNSAHEIFGYNETRCVKGLKANLICDPTGYYAHIALSLSIVVILIGRLTRILKNK